MHRKPTPPRFKNDRAWNRYRAVYEEDGQDTFFPSVGIKPVSEGGLLAAGLYISERLGLPVSSDPHDFLEQISVSNWSKFTIKSKTNKDEVRDPKILARSLSYVVSELIVLRPAIATLPCALWNNPLICTAVWTKRCFPKRFTDENIIAALQSQIVVSGLYNRNLRNRIREAGKSRRLSNGTALEKWLTNIGKRIGTDPWRYIAYVADVLKEKRFSEDLP